MDAFFKRVKNAEKPGFPRVRPRHSFFTLCYPASYLKIENKVLILPTGGRGKNKKYPDMRAKLTEPVLISSVKWPSLGMPEATTMPPLVTRGREDCAMSRVRLLPLTWGSRRWQSEQTSKANSIMWVALKDQDGTITSLTKSDPSETMQEEIETL